MAARVQTAYTFTAVAGCPHLPFLSYLEKMLPKAGKLVKNAPAEVSLVLVGGSKMAALHQQFMDIPGPTDVLTFELDYDKKGRCTAGEIVVCVPYAQKEAKKRKTDVNLELLLYSLHGLLHLSGFDDLNPAAYKKMHAEEDRILTAIGVGAVFETAVDARKASKYSAVENAEQPAHAARRNSTSNCNVGSRPGST